LTVGGARVLWQGKRLLRLWFLRPIVDLRALSSRHDAMEAFIAHPDVAASIKGLLKKVGCALNARPVGSGPWMLQRTDAQSTHQSPWIPLVHFQRQRLHSCPLRSLLSHADRLLAWHVHVTLPLVRHCRAGIQARSTNTAAASADPRPRTQVHDVPKLLLKVCARCLTARLGTLYVGCDL
jgi:hypothetical protein